MKVAIIMNTLDRYKLTASTFAHNIKNAGAKIDSVFISDNGSSDERTVEWVKQNATNHFLYSENIGNAQALNIMVDKAIMLGCKIICKLDNDIELPKNWLKKAQQALKDEKVGIVGFHCVATKPKNIYTANTVNLLTGSNVFSSWVFHHRVIQKVGYFSTFTKYGLWDSDFNKRCRLAGFTNGYIQGMDSEHKGHDVGEDTHYRKMKDAELTKAKKLFTTRWQQINENKYYVDKRNNLL